MAFLSQLLLLGLGIFLMIVILLQRGRGGGLAGAFGGLGGQSAFGTKAGDVFTKITVVMAVAWVIVAGGSGLFLRAGGQGTRAKDLGEVNPPGATATDDEGAAGAGSGAAPFDGSTPGSESGSDAGTSSTGNAETQPPPPANAPSGPDADAGDAPAESTPGNPEE